MDASNLAKMLFSGEEQPAAITMHNVESNKQLFFVLFDLFLKGIMAVCSSTSQGEGSSVLVHEITEEQFSKIARCMMTAGIHCVRTTETDPRGAPAGVNIEAVRLMPDDLPLESYRIEATVRGVVHTVWFRIVRNIEPWNVTCAGRVAR